MPVRSWRDLVEADDDEAEGSKTSSPAPPPPAVAGLGSKEPGIDVAGLSPRLGGLLGEQDQLRHHLAVLSGQEATTSDRDSARFALTPRDERVAEDRRFERSRNRREDRTSPQPRQQPTARTGGSGTPQFRGRHLAPAGTQPRSAVGRERATNPVPGSHVDRFAEIRSRLTNPDDAARRSTGPVNPIDRDDLIDRFTKPADLSDRFDDVRNGRSGLDDVADRFDDVRNGRTGLDDVADRFDDARSRLTEPDDLLSRVGRLPRSALDRSLSRVNLSDDWAERRDKLRRSVDEVGTYRERSRQVLSVLEGGSGSLEERAERAMDKLAAKKEAEAADLERRERAKERRRDREAQR